MDKLDIFKDVYNQNISVEEAMSRLTSEKTVKQDTYTKLLKATSTYVTEHKVYDKPIVLGVTYCAVAIEDALNRSGNQKDIHLSKFLFQSPVVLENNDNATIEVVRKDKSEQYSVRVLLQSEGTSIETASYYYHEAEQGKINDQQMDIQSFINTPDQIITKEEIYNKMKAVRVEFGPSLKTVEKVWVKGQEVISELTNHIPTEKYAGVSPVFLDGAIVGSLSPYSQKEDKPYVPILIQELIYFRSRDEIKYCHSVLKKMNSDIVLLDIDLYAEDGMLVIQLHGVTLKKVDSVMSLTREVTSSDTYLSNTAITNHTYEKSTPESKYTPEDKLKSFVEEYLKDKVLQRLKSVSGNIDITRNFLDLGLESNQLVALVDVIEQDMKIELYPTLFFEYQNIKEVANYLLDQFNDKIREYFGDCQESGTDTPTESGVVEDNIELMINKQITGHKDIAIIGMQGMFGKSRDLDEFWENIQSGADMIEEIPIDHFDYKPWFSEDMQAKDMTYSKWGSFIQNVDKFDADFFHIAPREAETMDPQLRLLLQVLYNTVEDAGVINEIRGSKTGIYVGACFQDYSSEMGKTGKAVEPYDGSGNAQTMYANRPSFFFDLKGPSMAVDTACSSSLVAIHLACKALMHGECEMAFAAGINLLLSSWHYRYFSSIQALSPTGRCHTFDEKADGYVPGEGIAAILLKPLDAAIRDGDRIHCVIKGSAVNHGGYTPSITAPSMKQETKVILDAWESAGINPETLGYIEAHGTGTKLGDPIEVNALKEAFKHYTDKGNFCALGSAKANIGHTEGAAGIAGVIKAALTIKNKKIPAMPFFEKLNSYINIEHTPLYINEEPVTWDNNDSYPCRAGISSFGFGGTYAHLVLEEYQQEKQAVKKQQENIIIISAKTETALHLQVKALRNSITEKMPLEKIASTLAFAREEHEIRVAFVAEDIKRLIKQFEFFEKKQEAEGIYDASIIKASLEYSEKDTAKAYEDRNLEVIAKAWISGKTIDWKFVVEKLPVLSIPGYQFDLSRYWVMDKYPRESRKDQNGIHYLIDSNVSTFSEQKYKKMFHQNEPYLKDHKIGEYNVLPGVITLEMVHTAVVDALADQSHNTFELQEFCWNIPITVPTEQIAVYTEFLYQENQFSLHVYSESNKNIISHAQGRIVSPVTVESVSQENRIAQIKKEATKVYTGDECYRMLEKQGLVIGPSLRAMKKLYISKDRLCVELENEFGSSKGFIINPSLLDASIQAMIGFSENTDMILHIPYSVRRIRYSQELKQNAYAVLVLNPESNREKREKEVDITLYDENGLEAVKMEGLILKPFMNEFVLNRKTSEDEILVYKKVWRKVEIGDLTTSKPRTFLLYNSSLEKHLQDTVIDSLTMYDHTVKIIQNIDSLNIREHPKAEIIFIDEYGIEGVFSEKGEIIQRSFEQLMLLLKTVIQQKNHISIYYITNLSMHEGMEAFLKSAVCEESQLSFKLISNASKASLLQLANDISSTADNSVIRYDNNDRYCMQVEESFITEGKRIFDNDKVYVITGGMGKLGYEIASDLMKKYHSQIILLGSREKDYDIEHRLNSLNQGLSSPKAAYYTCDVKDYSVVVETLDRIRKQYKRIDGILHLSGCLQDSLLRNKSMDDAKQVVAVKALGAIHMDLASRNDKLDFFLCFSSITAVNGNAGQADYAYANGCLNTFTMERNRLVQQNKAYGHTHSICWPIWENGGMLISLESLKQMYDIYGIKPISLAEGTSFLTNITDDSEVVIPIKGNHKKVRQILLEKSDIIVSEELEVVYIEKALLEENLTKLLAHILNANVTAIKRDKKMSDYGLESISITQFSREISEKYQIELRPSVFYEVESVQDLAGYLLKHYPKAFILQTCKMDEQVIDTDVQREIFNKTVTDRLTESKKPIRFEAKVQEPKKLEFIVKEPIAIIGMAGVMPGCDDLDQFWEALSKEQDLISVVPASRWDWKQYYGNPKKEYGKTLCNKAGFIRNVEDFDAEFFMISAREAEAMDPQQRLYIKTVWECIENAGYKASDLSGTNTGLFVGVGNFDYSDLMKEYEIPIDSYSSTGIAHSMLANRISYMLNLKGISQPIDTACSSSLVAIHHAVQSIEHGFCDMAIAGGVNLILTPNMTIAFSKAGMLSEDCSCKTFDEAANGYARGEGAGAILMKPLSKAVEDGDYIHALVLGGSVNHGGRANSLTAPNPQAQSLVIRDAYRRSNVNPDTITYIEAHGTGTVLGDPVEIEGLCRAFDVNLTDKSAEYDKYCGIGSVKTNIGHLETAAGIAGILKVILAMKNKTLPANIHYSRCNPYINLEHTPFYIVDRSMPWKCKVDRDNNMINRRAGVSSFGFGGVNSHIVLEEYNNTTRMLNTNCNQKEYVFVLSADSRKQVEEYAQKLLSYMEHITDREEFKNMPEHVILCHVAYTLQVGREERSERLAIVALNYFELMEHLHGFLGGKCNQERVFYQRVEESGGNLLQKNEIEDILKKLVRERNYTRLAQIWVKGMQIEWNLLYPEKLVRVPLPTYPFHETSYWLPENNHKPRKSDTMIHGLSPVIDRNISNLDGLLFEKTLSQKDFYVRDHVIHNQYVLPGVAYLEMIKKSSDLVSTNTKARIFDHIIWKQPVTLGQNDYKVKIAFERRNNTIMGRVTSDSESENQIHFQCTLNYDLPSVAETVELDKLGNHLENVTNATSFYEDFKNKGLMLGSGLKAVESIQRSESQVLIKYAVPAEQRRDYEQYVLHPSIMDAAITSPKGILGSDNGKLYIPFSVDRIIIHDKTEPEGYIYTRIALMEGNKVSELRKYDISILSREGKTAIEIKGFLPRMLKSANHIQMLHMGMEKKDILPVKSLSSFNNIVLFAYSKEELNEFRQQVNSVIHNKMIYVTMDDYQEKLLGLLNQNLSILYFCKKEFTKESGKKRSKVLRPFYELYHFLLQEKFDGQLVKILVTNEVNSELFGAIQGLDAFAQSVNKENHSIKTKVLHVTNTDVYQAAMKELLSDDWDNQIVYRNENQRYIRCFNQYTQNDDEVPVFVPKNGNHYLITGGLGKLGVPLAYYIANLGGNLILTGRSGLDDRKNKLLDDLRKYGVDVTYYACDVTDQTGMAQILTRLHDSGKELHGILHLAGTADDKMLIHKTYDEMEQTIAIKVDGAYCLDQVTENEPLDFFLMYSSITGIVGNYGQADYAYSNAVLDIFATERNRMVEKNERRGRTIAIAWSLWDNSGIQISETSKKYLETTVGMVPILSKEGINILQQASCFTGNHVIVLKGNPAKLSKLFHFASVEEEASFQKTGIKERKSTSLMEDGVYSDFFQQLEEIVCTVVKKKGGISRDKDLSQYGYDSITYSELAEILNNKYGFDLSPAFFFEYPTLEGIYKYLCKTYEEAITKVQIPPISLSRKNENKPTEDIDSIYGMIVEPIEEKIHNSDTCDAVAVIGLSCIMPGSEDADSYFEHLVQGDDLISVVPRERWDWNDYEGDTNQKWGGFINDVQNFDSKFFRISPKEATLMDPQHRLFIQTVWNTIEDAGYKAEDLRGSNTGIFVGICGWDYNEVLRANSNQVESLSVIGIAHSVLPNRISYLMDWHGPSEPIDTACSSSLVALHKAVEQIRTNHCDYAIAGGVNLILTPTVSISFHKAGMLSPNGRCRAFDSEADGYVRGEGVGAVLLKKYSKAVEDGDHIYAVIKGSAVNHGGQVNSFTVPNPNSQADVIVQAWKNAQIEPDTISYIEAHGTGTKLGDPVEIQGIRKAFMAAGIQNFDDKFCAIGSVKSNIGHLEAAAGIAGIIKVIKALEHKIIPPTIHFNNLNPHIRMDQTPLYIASGKAKQWPDRYDINSKIIPKRAGISSFGFGGVNAHIVFEEAPERVIQFEDKKQYPFVLSAKNEEQLRVYAKVMMDYLLSNKKPENLRDISYSLVIGREPMEYRLGFYAENRLHAAKILQQYLDNFKSDNIYYHDNKHDNKQLAEDKERIEIIKEKDALVGWIYNVDTDALVQACMNSGRRISLPGYPFAKIRHWVKKINLQIKPEDDIKSSKITENSKKSKEISWPISSMTYRINWEMEDHKERNGLTNEDIVILTGQSGFALAEHIASLYNAENIYTIRTQDMVTEGNKILAAEHIYFLGGIREEEIELSDQDTLDGCHQEGIYALHQLFHILEQYSKADYNLKLTVITQNVCKVVESDIVHPAGGTLFGYLNSAVKEYPYVDAVCIDIEKVRDKDRLKTFAGMICHEECARNLKHIAYRKERRFISKILPVTLADNPTAFRKGGVYVILGGMGGIGKELSKYLAESYHANIAVIGRSTDVKDKVTKHRKEIEELGGRLIYITADAGNIEQMKEAVSLIEAEYGQIQGVIHSAIVLKDMLISNMQKNDLDITLWPKVNGSIGLYQAFKGKNLDFMLFLSSVQSFTGMRGQSNYSAACTFKDSFSKYVACNESWNVRVINWGYWGSIGIVSTQEYQKRMMNQGVYSIEPMEGMACIEAVLSNPLDQLIVLKGEAETLKSIGITCDIRSMVNVSTDMSSTEYRNRNYTVEDIIGNAKGFKILEDYSRYQLLKVFQDSGLLLHGNEVINIEDMMNLMCIHKEYKKLFNELLSILQRGNYIELIGSEIRTTEKVHIALSDSAFDKAALRSQYREITDYLNLIDTCMEHYSDILCGKTEATSIIFPDGGMDLVGKVYKGNPLPDFYNEMIGQMIVAYVQKTIEQGHKGKIRILEIGAGTGGTSEGVLKKLDQYRDAVVYVYTDISESFLKYGKRVYGSIYPFMEFKLFDATKESREDIGVYDMAFGANVLHATADMDITLRVVKQKLKKNGILFINEMVKKEEYVTLTFGLLEGWWLYKDPDNRIPGSPLLDDKKWKEVLERNGFLNFNKLNQGECEILPQDVLTAVSDGVILLDERHLLDSHPANDRKPKQTVKFEDVPKGAISCNFKKHEILIQVKSCLAKVLGMNEAEFEPDTPFVDLGIDSILSTEFIQLINRQMSIALRPTELYSSSNLMLLVDKIYEDYHKSGITTNLIDIDDKKDAAVAESLEEKSSNEKSNIQTFSVSDLDNLKEADMLLMLKQLYDGTAKFHE